MTTDVDDRDTDRPKNTVYTPPLFSFLGWHAGGHLPLLLPPQTLVSGIYLLHSLTELTALTGNLAREDGSLPGPLTIAHKAATAAWHRMSYFSAPLDARADAVQGAWGNPLPEHPPCVGIGMSLFLKFAKEERSQFCFAIRSDLQLLGVRVSFAPDVRDLATIDRTGCEFILEAIRTFPEPLSIEKLPKQVHAIQLKKESFSDTS